MFASTVNRIVMWNQSRTYSAVGAIRSVQPARSTAPSERNVTNWFGCIPWAMTVSWTPPSAFVTVPHTAWNQPSRREVCAEECT